MHDNNAPPEDALLFANGMSLGAITDFSLSLIGEPPDCSKLDRFVDLEFLFIPEHRQLLMEIDGEQRRASKRQHYSILVGS